MLHNLKEKAYLSNQTIVKVLGFGEHKKIKLICMGSLRNAGVEIDDKRISERGTVNDEKLNESITRTKRTIFELAYCNDWNWFFTGTIDEKKFSRTDLKLFYKCFSQWLRDYHKKTRYKN